MKRIKRIKISLIRRKKTTLILEISKKKSDTNPFLSELFKPEENDHYMVRRKNYIVKVIVADTERYKNLAVPFMQGLIIQNKQVKNKTRNI